MAAANVWTREQITVLIENYREESRLYAVKSANYHNKHLRNEALGRVRNAVSSVRPGVSLKDCLTKVHSLRNQFNLENNKRRNSLNKSGNGAEDVYIPSLWYFHHMRFLDEHCVPRRSKSSKIFESSTQSTTFSEKIVDYPLYVSDGFDESGVLRVNCHSTWEDQNSEDQNTNNSEDQNNQISEDQNTQISEDQNTQNSDITDNSNSTLLSPICPSSSPAAVPKTPTSSSGPSRAQSAPPAQKIFTAVARPPMSLQPTELLSLETPAKLRRKPSSGDAAFTVALESIVETLKVQAMPPPSISKSKDPADCVLIS